MKSYHNIEQKKFPVDDYYVGYGNGVWRIRKNGQSWSCYHVKTGKMFIAKNMDKVSERLDEEAK